MKIYVGCDHKGVEIAQRLIDDLRLQGYEVHSTSIKNSIGDDYPDFAQDVASKVLENDGLGILLCGTGIGMSIAANKIKGIRAAKVDNVEEARLAKDHNGANIITFSFNKNYGEILAMSLKFIETPSASEERHLRRIEKINNLEK